MSKGQGKLLKKKLIKVHKQNSNQGKYFKELTLLGWLIETCVSNLSTLY